MKAKKIDKEIEKFEREIKQAFKGIEPEPVISFDGFTAHTTIWSTFIGIKKTRNNKYELWHYGHIDVFETVYECVNALLIDETNRLTKDLEYTSKEAQEFKDKTWSLCKEQNYLINSTSIAKIIHNKGTTVVWFKDSKKVVVRKAKGVKDDIYSAVAYAIAKKMHVTNAHFKHLVDKRTIK